MLTPKKIFSIEHSKAAYWADFGLYALAIAVLVLFLFMSAESIGFVPMAGFVFLGLLVWSFLEYTIHRFVLHKVEPFKTWHALHHHRPRALILAPTILSSALIGLLIFTPVYIFSSAVPATAITVGLLIGYLGYAFMHHAIHHWPASQDLLRNRKRMHSLHHRQSVPTNFGVTSSLWDHLFGSYRKL